jgi:hypothetical protein
MALNNGHKLLCTLASTRTQIALSSTTGDQAGLLQQSCIYLLSELLGVKGAGNIELPSLGVLCFLCFKLRAALGSPECGVHVSGRVVIFDAANELCCAQRQVLGHAKRSDNNT